MLPDIKILSQYRMNRAKEDIEDSEKQISNAKEFIIQMEKFLTENTYTVS